MVLILVMRSYRTPVRGLGAAGAALRGAPSVRACSPQWVALAPLWITRHTLCCRGCADLNAGQASLGVLLWAAHTTLQRLLMSPNHGNTQA